MRFIQYIFIIISVVVLQNCAQISAPTGGPEDVTPPQLDSLGTFPVNYSTNYSGDKITLTFDEYFVLKNPSANVFFSPSLDFNPEFITTGKTLTIILNNELKENTTYTINFGDAISDFNMGNKINDFKYVFSTGDYLDSMFTYGKIIDAFSGKPKKDVLVMLYDSITDSIVSKSKPIYYAKTNKDGLFNINYIKAGIYKIAALEDKNRNFLYDLPNEMIGSLDSNLILKDSSSNQRITIALFEKDHIKQGIKTKSYTFPGKLSFTFQRPSDSVEIISENGKKLNFHSLEYSKNKDSLIVWKPEIENKKNELLIQLDTTLKKYNIYGFSKPKKDTGLKVSSFTKTIEVDNPFVMTFERPLLHFDTSLIKIYQDSIRVRLDSVKMDNRTFSLFFNKKEDVNYKYQFNSTAFKDIFGYSNKDTLSGFITIRKSDYFGVFTLNLNKKDSSSFIIQLMNENRDVLRELSVTGSKTISFNKLHPGKYIIKAIADKNKNGKWDTGDYYNKLKPESVLFFEAPIVIRSNWEVAETWEL